MLGYSFCDTSIYECRVEYPPPSVLSYPKGGGGGGGKGEGTGAYVYMMYKGTTAVTADSA